MTTQVLARESVVTKARPRTVARDPFFAAMSAVILAIVLSGFAPTLYLRPVFKPLPIPGYLYLHGIVLTSWFVWFTMQTFLIQSRRTALHRRLGVAGQCLPSPCRSQGCWRPHKWSDVWSQVGSVWMPMQACSGSVSAGLSCNSSPAWSGATSVAQ